MLLFTILLILLRLQGIHADNCNCRQTFTFGNKLLGFVDSYQGTCITGPNLKPIIVSTFFGTFTEAGELLKHKCDDQAENQVRFQMKPFYNYVIVQNHDKEEYMIIVTHLYYNDIILNTYMYKNVYHKNDFECFHTTFTNIEGKEDAFCTTLGAKKFKNNHDLLRCFWFKEDKDDNIQLTYNTQDLVITRKRMELVNSPIYPYLDNCDETATKQPGSPISKRITKLDKDQTQFCVPNSGYHLDRIKRSAPTSDDDDDGDNESNKYCRSIHGRNTCFMVGDDFEYALFSSTSSGSKFMVISHGKYTSSYKPESNLNSDFAIARDQIMCSQILVYSDGFMKWSGVFDTENDLHCIIPSDFVWSHNAIFTLSSNSHTILFHGCLTHSPAVINPSLTIKIDSTKKYVCLQNGNTIIKRISPSTIKQGKFILDEQKLCFSQYTASICYRLADEINYVIITNRYTQKDTLLIGSYDVYNNEGTNDYIYETAYYKNEIVCMKKTLISNYESIKATNYLHSTSEDIKCFIIELMTKNDKIQIGANAGCDARETQVIPDQARTSALVNLQTVCLPFIKARTANDHLMYKVTSEDILTKCMQLTCSLKIHAFSRLDFTSGSAKVRDCREKPNDCVDTHKNMSMVYLVKNTLKTRNLYVSATDFTISLVDILYSENYYKSEVVCFTTTNIAGQPSVQTFQFQYSTFSCSVISDLDSDKVEIRITESTNCQNTITLHKRMVNPYVDGKTLQTTCQYLVSGPSTVPISVDRNTFKKCMQRTCSKINFYFDVSLNPDRVSFKSTNCEDGSTAQSDCLTAVIRGAVAKITSPRPAGSKYLYTKSLTENIPDAYYYSGFYGVNDFVCFNPSHIKNLPAMKEINAHIENSQRICFITQLITDRFSLELNIDTLCHRDIVLSSAVDTTSPEFDTKCSDFHTMTEVSSSKIISTNINQVKECITGLCMKPEYQIMKDGTIKYCKSDATCSLDEVNSKYFKIISRYNKNNLYVITQAEQITEILTSDKSGYYKSQFYESDLVCYKSTSLRPEDIIAIPGLIQISTAKHCFIVKELSDTKIIRLNVRPGCTRQILLLNKPNVIPNQITVDSNDHTCRIFTSADATSSEKGLSLENLKKCVRNYCLKPIFIIKKSPNHGDFSALYQQCGSETDACVSDATDFDYVKLQNPYTEEVFYVKNSNMRTISIEESFFYPSPFYKNEVFCIKTTRLEAVALSLAMSNSYVQGDITCIIINELNNDVTDVAIDKNACQRSINIQKDNIDPAHSRTIDNLKCKDFLLNDPSQSSAYSTNKQELEICLTNTCMKIVSTVEIENNKPLIYSTITPCATDSQFSTCIETDKLYDFIKISNSNNQVFRFFRLYPITHLDAHTPSKIEYYRDEYYSNDIICFNYANIIGNDDLRSQSGIFLEKSRICIIANMLANEIDIEYKITDTYNQRIKIKKTSSTTDIVTLQSLKTECNEFFNSHPAHSVKYYSYELNKLKGCFTKTRSLLAFFVQLSTTDGDYAHQKLRVCNHHTNIESCLTGVSYFDVMKVMSPYRTDGFYIRSDGLTKTSKDVYQKFVYKNTYYSDDVICIHEDLIQSHDQLNNKVGIITLNNVKCIIVRDTVDVSSISVKLFNKCFKSIYFSRYTSETSENSQDICSSFYTQLSTTSIVTLTLASLKSCIVSTCSNIEFLTENMDDENVFVKKYNDCENMKSVGAISCLASVKSYFLAKIKRGQSDSYLYVQQDAEDDFDVKEYDSYFYSSTYYKDQMVCFNKLKLPEDLAKFSVIQKGTQNLVCLYPTDSAQTTKLLIKTKDNCNKEISFDLSQSYSTPSPLPADECKIFHSVENPANKINLLSYDNIKTCIVSSCSKVLSVINRNTQQNAYTSETNTFCSSQFGDHSCITGQYYDFAFISNSYLTETIIFQSTNYDATQAAVLKTSFDKSVYFRDDIICHESTFILDLDSISTQEGVYSNQKRTCVIGSKIRKPISFMLKVPDDCNRTIHVMNSELDDSSHPLKNLDDECGVFYNNSQTLVVQKQETLLKCVAHTCGKIEYIHQSISDEKGKVSDGKEDRKKLFTYAVFTSQYSTNSILVISEDVQIHWNKLFEATEKYDPVYSSERIVCFKNNIFTSTSSLKKYMNTNLNKACVKPEVTDKELLLSIESGKTQSLKLLKHDDTEIIAARSKAFKFILHALRPDKKSIVKVLSHDEKIDDASNGKGITDFNGLESCIEGKEGIAKTDDFLEDIIPDQYAMTISSSFVLNSRIGFLLKNHSSCAKSLKSETVLPSEITISDLKVDLHRMDCVMIVKDTLAVKLNSETIKESLNTEIDCLETDQLQTKCNVVHEYNQNIIICYISKSRPVKSDDPDEDYDDDDDDDDDVDKSYQPSPVYVMIKKGNCYMPKIMRYHRIAMCNLDATGLAIKIFDFDIKGEKKSESKDNRDSAQATGGTWSILGLGVIGSAILYSILSVSRRKNYRKDKEYP